MGKRFAELESARTLVPTNTYFAERECVAYSESTMLTVMACDGQTVIDTRGFDVTREQEETFHGIL